MSEEPNSKPDPTWENVKTILSVAGFIFVIIGVAASINWVTYHYSAGNDDIQGKIVQPVKWDNETYYFPVTGASWAVSKNAFFNKHPELIFIGASPDNTGVYGKQIGTWAYCRPHSNSSYC